jgi:hypothetical protein
MQYLKDCVGSRVISEILLQSQWSKFCHTSTTWEMMEVYSLCLVQLTSMCLPSLVSSLEQNVIFVTQMCHYLMSKIAILISSICHNKLHILYYIIMNEFTKVTSHMCHAWPTTSSNTVKLPFQHHILYIVRDTFTNFISLACHEPQHFVLENPHYLVVGVVASSTYLQTPNNRYLVTNHLVLLTTH